MRNALMVDYAAQPWAMEPVAMQRMFAALAEIESTEAVAAVRIDIPSPMRVENGRATIPITGILLKTVPAVLKLIFGSGVTGYDDIRRMVQAAVDDPLVTEIEMRITSPGGMVAGGMEAAQAIRAADAIKPVTAVVEDLCASGAYWLATSARRIEANANAEVGSIGVYTYYLDWTGFDDKMGVKTIVVRSGEHKGMGLDAITDTQIAAVKEVIDQMAGHFIDQVAAGRRVARQQAAEWATGRVWLAPAAMQMGLIDAVTAPQQAAPPAGKRNESATEAATETLDTGDMDMPQEQTDITTAEAALANEKERVSALQAAFASDPAFALEAVGKGWSVTEAKAERHDRLEKEAAARCKGSDGLEYHDSAADGGEDFMQKATQIAREEKITRTEAMRRLAHEEPDLYERFRAGEAARPVKVRSGKKAAGRVTMS